MSVCFYCSAVLIFTEDALRLPSLAELEALVAEHDELARIVAAVALGPRS